MSHHQRYDIESVDGIDELRERMHNASSIRDWSFILSDYIKFGNNKVSDKFAIFNMGSATDCVNRQTKNCQVPDGECYAYNDENTYTNVLPYRRRQEYLWDCLDADTFAKAFRCLVDRKRNPVDGIRFNESGDFRHDSDIIKTDRIAEQLSPQFDVYTYSASNYLNWSYAEHFTVNASNELSEYGDRRFIAVDSDKELPDDAVWCPFDYWDGDLSNRPKCGECRLCIDEEGPDVAIPLH